MLPNWSLPYAFMRKYCGSYAGLNFKVFREAGQTAWQDQLTNPTSAIRTHLETIYLDMKPFYIPCIFLHKGQWRQRERFYQAVCSSAFFALARPCAIRSAGCFRPGFRPVGRCLVDSLAWRAWGFSAIVSTSIQGLVQLLVLVGPCALCAAAPHENCALPLRCTNGNRHHPCRLCPTL